MRSSNETILSDAFEQGLPWSGHRERLRLRAETEGLDTLKLNEQLELMLSPSLPRTDLDDVTRAMADAFGTLSGVFTASAEALDQVEYMTPQVRDWVLRLGRLVLDYTRAYLHDVSPRLYRPYDVRRFAEANMDALRGSGFWAFFLDMNYSLMYAFTPPRGRWWSHDNLQRLLELGTGLTATYAVFLQFASNLDLRRWRESAERLRWATQTVAAAGIQPLDYVISDGRDFTSLYSAGIL